MFENKGSTGADALAESYDKLAMCIVAMDELEARCCAPGRSPRMVELRESLDSARTLLGRYENRTVLAEDVVAAIEVAGGQIGSLQVSCCAPARTPLYDALLHDLMQVQRAVKKDSKLAH